VFLDSCLIVNAVFEYSPLAADLETSLTALLCFRRKDMRPQCLRRSPSQLGYVNEPADEPHEETQTDDRAHIYLESSEQ
jgi:hypothetical protein